MRKNYSFYSFFVAAILLVSFSGCSSTKLTSSWSEPSFNDKPLKKILIAGVMRNDLHRRLYEDQFVQFIGKQGIAGVAAYSVIPDGDDHYSEEEIQTAVKQTGADAALIAHIIDVKKQARYVPPTYNYVPSYGYRRGFYDYYGMSYRTTYTPGYTTTDTIVKLETTVFSTSTEQMIWAGSTQSFNPSSAEKIIKENAELITQDMRKAGLL